MCTLDDLVAYVALEHYATGCTPDSIVSSSDNPEYVELYQGNQAYITRLYQDGFFERLDLVKAVSEHNRRERGAPIDGVPEVEAMLDYLLAQGKEKCAACDDLWVTACYLREQLKEAAKRSGMRSSDYMVWETLLDGIADVPDHVPQLGNDDAVRIIQVFFRDLLKTWEG